MIELRDDGLVFSFPEVHPGAVCRIRFKRTLRIPDDNREYPLPPGFSSFPLEHVEDHAARLPAKWLERGGAVLPMYQSEALWIHFEAVGWIDSVKYPFAVKIAAGKVNAVSGTPWANDLCKEPQDYVVVPEQPWLDGFSVGQGLVRQFVAMPLGQGYSAEEQITGVAEHGGLQILVAPMKARRFQELVEAARAREELLRDSERIAYCSPTPFIGLAPGGLMRQSVYDDPYGLDAWEAMGASRCFVHLLNSEQWESATGKPVPTKPLTAKEYADRGLPWFDYYDEGKVRLPGSQPLAGLDSVAAKAIKLGQQPLKDNDPVKPGKIIVEGKKGASVSDGSW